MLYRIFGGIFLVLLSAAMMGFSPLSQFAVGVIGLIGGVSLLAGL